MKNILLLVALLGAAVSFAVESWTTEGFEAFRRGTFGNAGHNLYVSKAGVLQRIFQYDLDKNGWFDLVFANCQDHHESAPSYVYDVATGTRLATLAGMGSRSGAVTDLNGDGLPDVVVTGHFDMVTPFAATDVYYGQPDGSWSDRCHIRLQTPHAIDTAVARFDGDSRPSLVFAMPQHKIVRVCRQTEIGFEWKSFTDYPIVADVIAAADFDGDGFEDLACRDSLKTSTTVYWGGEKGLDVAVRSEVPEVQADEFVKAPVAEGFRADLEERFVAPRLLEAVSFNGRKCFTLSTGKKLIFFFATKGREIRRELELPAPMAQDCATGDFNGDGLVDVAIAAQAPDPLDASRQTSWIWLNSKDGFVEKNRIAIPTRSACSVNALDNFVVFGQYAVDDVYTNDALVYSFENGAFNPEPKRFAGEDMRRTFLFRDRTGALKLFLVNHFSRHSDGFDRTFVYWGREGGRYDPKDRLEVPSWCAVETVLADLDDDGWAELLVCNNSENSLDKDPGHHLHHFGPNGFEPERSQTLQTDVGWGAMVADFNRDGFLDVITVSDHWNALSLFAGGPAGLRRTKDYVVFPETDEERRKAVEIRANAQEINRGAKSLKRERSGMLRWPVAVDVNRDGWLDIACPAGARSYLLWGGPDGFDVNRRQEFASYFACGVRAADLDGNGWPELIFGGHCSQPQGDVYREPHHSYLHVYWNGPEGLDESRKTILRADAASNLCVGDFDGNGWLDIFSCSYQGDVDRDINSFIYWNRGGRFGFYDRQDLVTHAPSGCLAVDFNEDGLLDLAVANHKIFGDHRGYSEVWWNTREGFLPSRTTKLPTMGPHGMTAIEPGNLLTRGPEEFYDSEKKVAAEDCVVAGIDVTAEIPLKTWVKTLFRTAATAEDLARAAWREPAGVRVAKGARMQYRLALGAKNSLQTPRVTKVVVKFEKAKGRERMSAAKTGFVPEHVALEVADPQAMANWWCANLGFRVTFRHSAGSMFIADASGTLAFEIYAPAKGVKPKDYWKTSIQQLHFGFFSDDPDADCAALVKAGATCVATDDVPGLKGRLLRDPQGIPFQIVKRAGPGVLGK